MSRKFPAGVATGSLVSEILHTQKKNNYALPAVNVVGSSNINATMETAVKLNAPVIIQFSNGGAAFNAGKALVLKIKNLQSLGGIAGARHIHTLAEAYGATVILHRPLC